MPVRNINEILASPIQNLKVMGENVGNTLRVACPGIIRKFNVNEQTVEVQLALKEHLLKESGEREWKEIPLLLDVPIVVPHAGGYSLTMPIKDGDECLVIFSDSCIDEWFTYGGVRNQMDKRRHDLSDGFAILGVWSQPNKIKDYSLDSCQLRDEKGETFVEIKEDEINLKVNNTRVEMKDNQINLKGNSIRIEGSTVDLIGSVRSNGLNINSHVHSIPEGTTSGPF